MQIAGNICTICGARVVIADEGAFCAACGTVVHRDCTAGTLCHVCSQPCHYRETPKADSMADALVPRALRPSGNTTPVGVAILLAASAVLLVGVMFYLMMLA